jgi:hypothetical protein
MANTLAGQRLVVMRMQRTAVWLVGRFGQAVWSTRIIPISGWLGLVGSMISDTISGSLGDITSSTPLTRISRIVARSRSVAGPVTVPSSSRPTATVTPLVDRRSKIVSTVNRIIVPSLEVLPEALQRRRFCRVGFFLAI